MSSRANSGSSLFSSLCFAAVFLCLIGVVWHGATSGGSFRGVRLYWAAQDESRGEPFYVAEPARALAMEWGSVRSFPYAVLPRVQLAVLVARLGTAVPNRLGDLMFEMARNAAGHDMNVLYARIAWLMMCGRTGSPEIDLDLAFMARTNPRSWEVWHLGEIVMSSRGDWDKARRMNVLARRYAAGPQMVLESERFRQLIEHHS